ncbi:hypothetical protein OE09_1134 [Flavobacteriaceae bacterium MAR_2010_72]|nr:hypothetical protein OE09_1134 [Flavobacteriaceae bacterium MAR_2010_72]
MRNNRLHLGLWLGCAVLFITIAIILTRQNKTMVLLGNQTDATGLVIENYLPNEGLVVKTLLQNNWLGISDIANSTYSQLREALVTGISKRMATSETALIKLSDNQLSSIALAYRFLLESKTKSEEALKLMPFQDLKQAIVNCNTAHTTYSVSNLKHFSLDENLKIAYQWWLPKKHARLIAQINKVDAQNAYYKLKDDTNKIIEVLRVVQANEIEYKYLGVYHRMVGRNHFILFLAGSNDLKTWNFITELGDRSHQGDIKKWGSGYLLVNEEDKKEGSNNIRVRFYASYHDLCKNRPKYSKALARNFSKYAEGTPDIRKIEGDSPNNSTILLGFHYFNNGDVDYQAMGILKDFSHWKAWKDEISNKNIIDMGFKGNIGARSAFTVTGSDFVLLEAQGRKRDFSSWRLLLGDGAFYTTLNLKTPKNASSFANPGVSKIADNELAITTFLPTEGNSGGENGQLLYTISIE